MRKVILSAIIALLCAQSFANDLIFARLKYSGGNWDSETLAWGEVADYLLSISNIRAVHEPVVVTFESKDLFDYPILFLTGDSTFDEWKPEAISRMKRYFDAGGVLIIDDSTGIKDSGFARSVKRELVKIFPNDEVKKIPENTAVFYSFFLLPKVCGTGQSVPYLEGVERNGQHPVMFSGNDMFGAWEKDKLGNWLKDCRPGGEAQRFEAQKLSVNIIMYAIVGTYKLDAIHSDYIRAKLNMMNTRPPGQ